MGEYEHKIKVVGMRQIDGIIQQNAKDDWEPISVCSGPKEQLGSLIVLMRRKKR